MLLKLLSLGLYESDKDYFKKIVGITHMVHIRTTFHFSAKDKKFIVRKNAVAKDLSNFSVSNAEFFCTDKDVEYLEKTSGLYADYVLGIDVLGRITPYNILEAVKNANGCYFSFTWGPGKTPLFISDELGINKWNNGDHFYCEVGGYSKDLTYSQFKKEFKKKWGISAKDLYLTIQNYGIGSKEYYNLLKPMIEELLSYKKEYTEEEGFDEEFDE